MYKPSDTVDNAHFIAKPDKSEDVDDHQQPLNVPLRQTSETCFPSVVNMEATATITRTQNKWKGNEQCPSVSDKEGYVVTTAVKNPSENVKQLPRACLQYTSEEQFPTISDMETDAPIKAAKTKCTENEAQPSKAQCYHYPEVQFPSVTEIEADSPVATTQIKSKTIVHQPSRPYFHHTPKEVTPTFSDMETDAPVTTAQIQPKETEDQPSRIHIYHAPEEEIIITSNIEADSAETTTRKECKETHDKQSRALPSHISQEPFSSGYMEANAPVTAAQNRHQIPQDQTSKGSDINYRLKEQLPSVSGVKHDAPVTTMQTKSIEPEDQLSRTQSKNTLEKPRPRMIPKVGDRRILAAVRLQKVYKSFRTRRQLADCAVLAEQKWSKVLDFAELKRSSISFFDIEKPESAVSKWSRATTRAAKVGKGLSKDAKARKLALQHWLEAIDPRHRYGHNLQFYYVRWLHCESKQPFFYWLDIGDGKEVNIIDRCPRSRLQQQCIKYLDPAEREAFEVIVVNGRLLYKENQKVVDTREPKGATLSAGRLIVEDGVLMAVWPHSGHYLPTEENFQAFMSFLRENNVDLSQVERAPIDEEDGFASKTAAFYASQHRTDENSNQSQNERKPGPQVSKLSQVVQSNILRRSQLLNSKIARLQIPRKADMVEEEFKTPQQLPAPSTPDESDVIDYISDEFSSEGFETAEDENFSEDDFIFSKLNIFEEYDEDEDKDPIPQETILRRINSHRRTMSYQLGEHLQFRWTTGAGPRIGCVRDYPSKLQFEVMEHVQLSPRSDTSSPGCIYSSPRSYLGPSALHKEPVQGTSSLCIEETEESPAASHE